MDMWINNVQRAFGSAVDNVSRVADDVADSFRRPRQQQQQRQDQRHPNRNFPFSFGHPSTAQPTTTESQRTPVASGRAIRQLPTILVAPEDLVDENNRECCICLEKNALGHQVMRLPCAHIFHSDCIMDWLQKHACTCPICRYELPTDDPMYEAGRSERMKARKPRYALYELKRMSIKDLVNINRGRQVPGVGEKRDFIQYLIDQGRIDLIPSPKPVDYKLNDLKAMKVSSLKKAMADAGVFFHEKDVIEKADMVAIFVNSGRLNLLEGQCLQEDEPHGEELNKVEMGTSKMKVELPAKRPLVETVEEASDDDINIPKSPERARFPIVMFPNDSRNQQSSQTNGELSSTLVQETGDGAQFSSPDEASHVENTFTFPRQKQETKSMPEVASFKRVSERDISENTDNEVPVQDISDLVCEEDITHSSPEPVHSIDTNSNLLIDSQIDNSATPSPALAQCPLSEYSIAQLLTLGREANVDISSCFERSEMVRILVAAGVTGRSRVNLQRSSFIEWSISQLRAIGSEVNIDLSQCSDQDEVIDQILHEANNERPHLRNYLRVLAPLATSTLSQLRATARSWEVDISDCLEKEEIIQRLVTRANHFGIC